ncbi:hypothetical protein ABFS83_14G153000 [Erythranthe nasuta]
MSVAYTSIVVIIIISSAVTVSAAIYLLLRCLSMRFHRSFSVADDVVVVSNRQKRHVADFEYLLDSLPIFTFRSVTLQAGAAGGDCAVCLSKFEPCDRLRLLPLCCHAFHAACIDAWIVSNLTCPLCRSAVLLPSPSSSTDVLDRIISDNSFGSGGGSFRIEIGSISRRRGDGEVTAAAAVEGGRRRQTYSLGSFEYIVGDGGCEVPVGFTSHSRVVSGFTSDDKQPPVAIPLPVVSGRRSWMRSITISPHTTSFRISGGRFFSGSSRRSQAVVAPEDLESPPG